MAPSGGLSPERERSMPCLASMIQVKAGEIFGVEGCGHSHLFSVKCFWEGGGGGARCVVLYQAGKRVCNVASGERLHNFSCLRDPC